MEGKKFNRLTVIRKTDIRQNRKIMWECVCDCGTVLLVQSSNLRNGNTKSCGCLQREKVLNMKMKHGKSGTRLHRIWKAMKTRCSNPNFHQYRDYGGRGITVCEEWEQSFESFHEWAIAHGYTDELTIDRINNDLGYCPQNCRWATRKEQNLNKRNNVKKGD